MLTGIKENSEYTAQITPYHGNVHAEILCKHESTKDKTLDLWLTVMDKSFGKFLSKQPREKDWQDARDWVNREMTNISIYGTVVVTQPIWIKATQ